MIIKNPTDQEIKVKIKGTMYVLEANGELTGLSKGVAEYWKNSLHNFLTLEEEGEEKLAGKEIVEDKKDVKEDEIEVDLQTVGRKKLDEIAESYDLNPSDYKNKGELIDVLMDREEIEEIEELEDKE